MFFDRDGSFELNGEINIIITTHVLFLMLDFHVRMGLYEHKVLTISCDMLLCSLTPIPILDNSIYLFIKNHNIYTKILSAAFLFQKWAIFQLKT